MFPENFSSILWFSGCLLALILVGVFFSKISQKQISVFEGNSALLKDIKRDQSIADSLKIELDAIQTRFETRKARVDDSTDDLSALRSQKADIKTELKSLEGKRSVVEEQIAEISSEFGQFKGENRAKARSEAIGEKLGSLFLKNGRMLEGVTIVRVLDDGLQVRHSGGILKLPPKELPFSFQRRFQWDSN